MIVIPLGAMAGLCCTALAPTFAFSTRKERLPSSRMPVFWYLVTAMFVSSTRTCGTLTASSLEPSLTVLRMEIPSPSWTPLSCETPFTETLVKLPPARNM